MLTEDYHTNRHVLAREGMTLCGKKTVKQNKVLVKGRFKGYKPGSATDVWGFYGSGRCKECLTKYLQRRLSPTGKKAATMYRARLMLGLPMDTHMLHTMGKRH
jgi:hypothetical protein